MNNSEKRANLPFYPASVADFKARAKNLAWYLSLPLQLAQETLSRIYGFENQHELQAGLAKDIEPGPFYEHYVRDENWVPRQQRALSILKSELFAAFESFDGWEKRRDNLFQLCLFDRPGDHRDAVRTLKAYLGSGKNGQSWPSEALASHQRSLYELETDFDAAELAKFRLADISSDTPHSMLERLVNVRESRLYLRTCPVITSPDPRLPLPSQTLIFWDELPSRLLSREVDMEIQYAFINFALESDLATEPPSDSDEPDDDLRYIVDQIPDGQNLFWQWQCRARYELAKSLVEFSPPFEMLEDSCLVVENDGPLASYGDWLHAYIGIEPYEGSFQFHEIENMSILNYTCVFAASKRNSNSSVPVAVMKGFLIVPYLGQWAINKTDFHYWMDAASADHLDLWKVLQFEAFPALGYSSIEDFTEDRPDEIISTANIEILPALRGSGLSARFISLFQEVLSNAPWSAWAYNWHNLMPADWEDLDLDDGGTHLEEIGLNFGKPSLFVFPIAGPEQIQPELRPENFSRVRNTPAKVSKSSRIKDPKSELRQQKLSAHFMGLREEIGADLFVYDPNEFPVS